MTLLDLSVPLGLGAVSSLHCAGMCGPIVLAYTLPIQRTGSQRLLTAHLFYNFGRIATYSVLGALAGFLGGGVATLGHMAGLERQAAVLIGIVMIVAGVFAGGWVPGNKLVNIGSGVPGVLSRSFGRLVRSGNTLALGSVMGLLPCGLVYAALLQAMSTSHPLDGALSMAAFGLGTAASLLGIGLLSGTFTARLGRYSGAMVSISVILLGVLVTWRGLTGSMVAGQCH